MAVSAGSGSTVLPAGVSGRTFPLSRLEFGFWLLSVVEVIVVVEPRFLQPTA